MAEIFVLPNFLKDLSQIIQAVLPEDVPHGNAMYGFVKQIIPMTFFPLVCSEISKRPSSRVVNSTSNELTSRLFAPDGVYYGHIFINSWTLADIAKI